MNCGNPALIPIHAHPGLNTDWLSVLDPSQSVSHMHACILHHDNYENTHTIIRTYDNNYQEVWLRISHFVDRLAVKSVFAHMDFKDIGYISKGVLVRSTVIDNVVG